MPTQLGTRRNHDFTRGAGRLVALAVITLICSCGDGTRERSFPTSFYNNDVKGLVQSTGAAHADLRCYDTGGRERFVWCRLAIDPKNFQRLTDGLEQKPLKSANPADFIPERFGQYAVVATGEDPCDHALRKPMIDGFFMQQWIPGRFGFFGANTIYDERGREACLILSIARG